MNYDAHEPHLESCPSASGPAASSGPPSHVSPGTRARAARQQHGSLEKEEAKLWRLALLFVVLLATALAGVSWERLQSLPYHLGSLLPVAVMCVAVAFSAFSYGRKKQVSELKKLVQNLKERSIAPSEEQLHQLGQVIGRSQRSFKELIDSFDDVAFACSLDGTLRTVNRSVSELLAIPYAEIVDRKLDDFLAEPPLAELASGLPASSRNAAGREPSASA